MFEIVFDKITLVKANKYVLLLTCANQTKRTNISQLWTSVPEFASIPIDDINTIQIKVCEVSHDKRLHIVGTGKIQQTNINTQAHPLFSGEIKIQQLVQGNRVCVGLCNITIIRKEQFHEVTSAIDALNEKEIKSSQQFQNNERQQQEQEQQQEQDDDQIRVQVHCGFNFYLGSAFKIVVEWGNSSFETTSIKDKINPIWSFGQSLTGNTSKPIELRVIDNKNNFLQNFKFQISSLIIMFPYHIRLIFKEEFMGATPEIFISILRQSHPKYSILQLPIKFCLKNLGEPLKSGLFLMVSLSKQPKLPNFITIDRNLYVTLQQVNKYLTSKTLGEQQRVDLIGLSNLQSEKTFSLLKSYLNRKLYLFVFHVEDMKKCFIQSNWSSCRLLERKNDFEVALRKVYYNGQSFTLKKYLQIFNPIHQMAIPEQQQSATDRWKLMTNNYLLRNKLVNKSSQHIQKLKGQIQIKGRQLVQLKKILKQVKLVNSSLTIKQKLMTVVKKKKIRLNAKQIDTNNLIIALIDKQTTLEQKKNMNAELALRMNCLTEIQENQQILDEQIVTNATKLLQLQQKITKMKIMESALSRQRIIIGQLQKRFEQKQIDRQINQALKEQGNKLQQIRQAKNDGLKNIYMIVREQNKKAGSLPAQIKHAEELLISLNEQYVQLKGL